VLNERQGENGEVFLKRGKEKKEVRKEKKTQEATYSSPYNCHASFKYYLPLSNLIICLFQILFALKASKTLGHTAASSACSASGVLPL
jgi:hypothetical protein